MIAFFNREVQFTVKLLKMQIAPWGVLTIIARFERGVQMRTAFTLILLSALAACGQAPANETEAAPAPEPVVDVPALLAKDDPKACVAPDVIRTAINVANDQYQQALAEGVPEIRVDTVKATSIDKNIHEVSCSANAYYNSPYTGDERQLQLIYKVSPSLDDENSFIASIFNPAPVRVMVSMHIAHWRKQQAGNQPAQATENAAGTETAATEPPSEATKICRAKVLHDVRAMNDAPSTMKAGEDWTDVTQFWANKETDDSYYCQHGGYCYPSHVEIGGKKVPAIKLLNCSVAESGEDSGDEILYSVG